MGAVEDPPSSGDFARPSAEKFQRDLKNFLPSEFSFHLTDSDGRHLNLSEYQGHIRLVQLWGTWC